MKVKINGIGVIEFPDSMEDAEVLKILEQFKPKKDDSLAKAITALAKKETKVIKEPQIIEVEKQVIVKEPQPYEVERVVTNTVAPTGWHFKIERDEDGITDIYAEPYE